MVGDNPKMDESKDEVVEFKDGWVDVVDVDCERVREVCALWLLLESGACDVDAGRHFVRRVGRGRGKVLDKEQGALQDGQRPSEDGPCSH